MSRRKAEQDRAALLSGDQLAKNAAAAESADITADLTETKPETPDLPDITKHPKFLEIIQAYAALQKAGAKADAEAESDYHDESEETKKADADVIEQAPKPKWHTPFAGMRVRAYTDEEYAHRGTIKQHYIELQKEYKDDDHALDTLAQHHAEKLRFSKTKGEALIRKALSERRARKALDAQVRNPFKRAALSAGLYGRSADRARTRRFLAEADQMPGCNAEKAAKKEGLTFQRR